MNILTSLLTIGGLCLFETISSIDNAIVNAEVLTTMGSKAKKWFLFWGLIIAVFVIRGLVPWFIIWIAAPSLGPIGAFTATFSSDQRAHEAIEKASPVLLMAGGVFLLFLFLNWLFLEPKHFGLKGEKFFSKQGVWFFAVASVILATIVWFTLQIDPIMAFGAVIGSTCYFIIHGFRENAEKQEQTLLKEGHIFDMSKIFYLMVIDATFSMDGVLGAFAFTLSVPLILIGNGLGALVVRQMTVVNIDRIQKYLYVKNGAMYSIFFLGIIMISESFGISIPQWVSPLITFIVVGYFFYKSKQKIGQNLQSATI